MIEINDLYTVNVFDTGVNGSGIAKIDNSIVFIKGLVEGDIAEIRITVKEKNYCLAEPVRIITYSDKREEPHCSICNECGGCSLSYINYDYENEIKKRSVIKAFRQAGLDYSLVTDVRHTPDRYNYRNKITLHYDHTAKSLGYYKNNTKDIVPVTSCKICSKAINSVLEILSECSEQISTSELNEIILQSSFNGNVTVTLKPEIKSNQIILKSIKEKYEKTIDASKSIQGIDSVIDGISMKYSSGAFRQVNEECFSLLLKEILDIVNKLKPNEIIDLYCGSGIIGIYLAKNNCNTKVFGVELNADSIKDAKVNAQLNSLNNISFHCGDASDFKKMMPFDFSPSLIVVDPPRNGLNSKTINELLTLSPDNIIYVSCNPFTLARDCKQLSKNYNIESISPFNMFPLTEHVETVVSMSRARLNN